MKATERHSGSVENFLEVPVEIGPVRTVSEPGRDTVIDEVPIVCGFDKYIRLPYRQILNKFEDNIVESNRPAGKFYYFR